MKIGITQRVETINSYGEIRDCIDQNWFKIFNELDLLGVQIPNQQSKLESWISEIGLDGFILSGGNDLSCLDNPSNPSIERDETEKIVLDYAYRNNLPVLGICRGLQMINYYFGGSLVSIENHIGLNHQIKFLCSSNNKIIYRNVNSYHSWSIRSDSLGEELIPFAWDLCGNVEAIKHSKLNWVGLMWHPERTRSLDYEDKKVFINLFFNICK